ncbi:MAG: helix-turn-helix transcriptional regulator [Salinisphaeraceae bacterium]|nr:helix-turn-helix transcriptional regulator [Salinisphaeraceae bacterium]
MDRFDSFIANLYRSSAFINAEQFKEWALLQLREVLPFDAALWGSGSLTTTKFHSITLLGISEKYPQVLEKTNEVNPIWDALMANIDKVVDSAAVVPDKRFYSSPIYKKCFSKFKIERILSTLHNEPRSGLVTLLSIYRFDRKNRFTKAEIACFERAVEHLVNAASHTYFTHLIRTTPDDATHRAAAVCDREGYLYEVQPQFLDLIEEHFPGWQGPQLPFSIPDTDGEFSVEGICGKTEALDDLACIQIWAESPLDLLTDREKEVVEGVCQGMTFKEIARITDIAPSTVSNHLYRIYRKLGINNRSSLAKLVKRQGGPRLLRRPPKAVTHLNK